MRVMSKVAPAAASFSEAPAWRTVGTGWRPLFGSFAELGFSFEWHEFVCTEPLDWGRSFHPGSLELCLNLAGAATLRDAHRVVELPDRMLAFYYQGEPRLNAQRAPGQQHKFITVEFSPEFLRKHFG